MRLYHGTNVDFMKIDLTRSKLYKDFGRGFYLTDIKAQAEDLARKRALLLGGEPVLQEYEFDDSVLEKELLDVLIFCEPTVEWAEFVYKNRNRKSFFKHGHDIVIGPIADDGVAYLLNRYEEGTYTIEELVRKLEYKHLNSQYFFGTERAIGYLKRII